MKSYSYAQITAQVGRSLRFCSECAASTPDADHRQMYRARANGALWLWDELTQGHQKPGDAARLRMIKDGQMELPL